jgi:hypothetical protein
MTPSETVEIKVVHSVYKDKLVMSTLEGGEVYPEKKSVLVKQIKVTKWFRKDAITSVEEVVTSKNTLAKKRSIIFDKYSGRFYETFHSPREILEQINSRSANPIGYNTYDSKIHTTRPQVHQSQSRRR